MSVEARSAVRGVGGGGGFGGMDTSELELQLQEAKLQCEIQKEEYENQIVFYLLFVFM